MKVVPNDFSIMAALPDTGDGSAFLEVSADCFSINVKISSGFISQQVR